MVRADHVGDRSGPDYIVAGAARCGTSAFTRFLASHPDVTLTTPKEPHFLAFHGTAVEFAGPGDDEMINQIAVTDPDEWRRLFDRERPDLVGEGSVSTLYYHERAIENIARFVRPDVPIVIMLRDPVERAYSSYLYMLGRGREVLPAAEAFAAEDSRKAAGWHHIWHYRSQSRYAEQLAPFLDRFGDRVEIVISEEFNADPSAHFTKMFTRLGVDPTVDIDTSQRINAGGVPRSSIAASAMNALRSSRPVRTAVKATTSHRLRERIRSANLSRPQISAELRAALAADLADVGPAVEDLLGRSLPWSHRA